MPAHQYSNAEAVRLRSGAYSLSILLRFFGAALLVGTAIFAAKGYQHYLEVGPPVSKKVFVWTVGAAGVGLSTVVAGIGYCLAMLCATADSHDGATESILRALAGSPLFPVTSTEPSSEVRGAPPLTEAVSSEVSPPASRRAQRRARAEASYPPPNTPLTLKEFFTRDIHFKDFPNTK